MYKKVIIKIGTNVITKNNGLLNKPVLVSIVEQIAQLKKKGIEVVVVSSGAMGAGRALIKLSKKADDVIKRQVLAAVGQIPLLDTYSQLFKKYGFTCAQVLATKEDFRDRKHYLNMKNCFDALLREEVVPIVNENDVISVSELMFTDNDELAGLIASMMNVDALIILTNVDGVLDKDPKDKSAKVISVIDPKKKDYQKCISSTITSFSRGGMSTKCKVAERLAFLGIVTHIINGERKNTLVDLVLQEGRGSSTRRRTPRSGTKFIAKKKVSNVKKWVAQSEGQEKGVVCIDRCAVEVLTATDRVASLLPIGATKIEGDFVKGDIVRVLDEKGKKIALGMVQYDSKKARQYIGKKGKKPLIHYDYLFLSS